MTVKVLTEHNLEFLSLKGDYTGSSVSNHVKMPHCWKSHVMAHFLILYLLVDSLFQIDIKVSVKWVYQCLSWTLDLFCFISLEELDVCYLQMFYMFVP